MVAIDQRHGRGDPPIGVEIMVDRQDGVAVDRPDFVMVTREWRRPRRRGCRAGAGLWSMYSKRRSTRVPVSVSGNCAFQFVLTVQKAEPQLAKTGDGGCRSRPSGAAASGAALGARADGFIVCLMAAPAPAPANGRGRAKPRQGVLCRAEGESAQLPADRRRPRLELASARGEGRRARPAVAEAAATGAASGCDEAVGRRGEHDQGRRAGAGQDVVAPAACDWQHLRRRDRRGRPAPPAPRRAARQAPPRSLAAARQSACSPNAAAKLRAGSAVGGTVQESRNTSASTMIATAITRCRPLPVPASCRCHDRIAASAPLRQSIIVDGRARV